MSKEYHLEELKKESREVEEELRRLEEQKEQVDREYSKVEAQEDEIYSQLYKCRDPYEYGRIETRLNSVRGTKSGIEQKRQELEQKLRGYRTELEKLKEKIDYLTPRKGKFIVEHERK